MKTLLLSLAAAMSLTPAFATPFAAPEEVNVVFDQQALEQRLLSTAAAVIMTRGDYDVYMKHFGAGSPLSSLPATRRAQFEASMSFGPQGLSGFDYTSLESDLTQSQIFAALVPFGQHKLASKFVISRVDDPSDTFMVKRFGAKRDAQKFRVIIEDDVDNSHKDYYCLSRGTCAAGAGYICTQNC